MQPDPRVFYRRRLPHYQPPNETFHVTFRLAGSLPNETVERLKREHAEAEKRIKSIQNPDDRRKARGDWGAEYFRKYDEFLDRASSGPSWLGEDSIAAKVGETIQSQDGKTFDLLTYCLMPNHVHLLATFHQFSANIAAGDVERSSDRLEQTKPEPSESGQRTEVRFTTGQYLLAGALKKLKGVSAYECNKLLHRRGAFWHHESYDHMIRNDAELERTIWYILANPVNAGLCRHWRDWKWTYLREGVIEL